MTLLAVAIRTTHHDDIQYKQPFDKEPVLSKDDASAVLERAYALKSAGEVENQRILVRRVLQNAVGVVGAALGERLIMRQWQFYRVPL